MAVATAIGLAQSQPRRVPRRHRLPQRPAVQPAAREAHARHLARRERHPQQDHNAVIRRYCVDCHNEKRKDDGGLSLETFDVAKAADHAAVAEKMILKLQAGMMPPPGARRPDPTALRWRSFSALETDRRQPRRGAPESRAGARSRDSIAPSTRARFTSCWTSTSTPASGCRSTR